MKIFSNIMDRITGRTAERRKIQELVDKGQLKPLSYDDLQLHGHINRGLYILDWPEKGLKLFFFNPGLLQSKLVEKGYFCPELM